MATEGLEKLLEVARSNVIARKRSNNVSADRRRAPKRRALAEAQRQRIVHAYRGGSTIASTMKATGFSEQTVYRVLYDNGYAEADLGRRITARTVEAILDHHRRGKNVRTLAGRYRIREETVWQVLEAAHS